jgi:hypothetical protein
MVASRFEVGARRARRIAWGLAMAGLASSMVTGCAHNAADPTTAVAPSTASSPNGAPPGNAPPEMAPAPYSSEELRAANKPGTVYRYKVEAQGQPTLISVMEFVAATPEGADIRGRLLDESGKEKEPAKVEHAAWDELRRHGEFPRAALKVEPGSVDVPAGKFETMIYTVQAPNGEIARFYFAKSYAGPPVFFYKERGGVRLMTSTLIERKPGD